MGAIAIGTSTQTRYSIERQQMTNAEKSLKIEAAKARAEADLQEKLNKIENAEAGKRGRNEDSPINSANKRLTDFAASGLVDKIVSSCERSNIVEPERIIRRALASAMIEVYHVPGSRMKEVKFPGSITSSDFDDLDV